MYIITKDFHFSAGHVIDGLPEDHKCGKPHGHNYIVRLFLRSEKLDSVGFVVDFGELSRFKTWIDQRFDHSWLNDVMDDDPTSAESLAYFIFKNAKIVYPQVFKVGIRETPKAWAFFTEDGS